MTSRRALTSRHRGGPFCDECGVEIRWIHLEGGRYIAAEKEPVYYIPDAGKEWIIEGRRGNSHIIKNARIWRPGDSQKVLKRGYRIHAFTH